MCGVGVHDNTVSVLRASRPQTDKKTAPVPRFIGWVASSMCLKMQMYSPRESHRIHFAPQKTSCTLPLQPLFTGAVPTVAECKSLN
eukprot:830383-Amphidinium_carterae.1